MTVITSVEESPIVSRDCVIETIGRQLHQAVNVHPRRFTVAQIAEESGVKARRIQAYMAGDQGEQREPTLSAALSIAVVLGPRAVNAILALIGYSASPLEDPEVLQPMQIVSDALCHLGTIGKAAADNRIDHTEEQATTNAADALIATVLPLSSHGRAV